VIRSPVPKPLQMSWIVLCLLSANASQAGSALETWNARLPHPSAETLNSVTFGAGRFVAVGDHGAVLLSTNGIDWQVAQAPTDARLNAIAFGSGKFLSGSTSGSIFVSDDGTHWTQNLSNLSYDVTAVICAEGTNRPPLYMAIGSSISYSDTRSVSLTSTDCIT
jgi:hypothetical protein